MSASLIPRSSWVKLYKELQQEAGKFTQFNYRKFFQRRIRDHFEKNKSVTDPEQQQKLYNEGLRNLEILKRQATISQIYPRKKTVVEEKLAL